MLQLISRRFLKELDEAPGGNNLQYILKCPCIRTVVSQVALLPSYNSETTVSSLCSLSVGEPLTNDSGACISPPE